MRNSYLLTSTKAKEMAGKYQEDEGEKNFAQSLTLTSGYFFVN